MHEFTYSLPHVLWNPDKSFCGDVCNVQLNTLFKFFCVGTVLVTRSHSKTSKDINTATGNNQRPKNSLDFCIVEFAVSFWNRSLVRELPKRKLLHIQLLTMFSFYRPTAENEVILRRDTAQQSFLEGMWTFSTPYIAVLAINAWTQVGTMLRHNKKPYQKWLHPLK